LDLPQAMVAAIGKLGQAHMAFVAEAYADLGSGPAKAKIIPIYTRIDSLAGESTSKIDCRNGCDFCCHYHVYATPLEIFAIAEEVQSWDPTKSGELGSKLRGYVSEVKGLGREGHIRANIACVFLDRGSCSIYPVRPLACRRHHSADREVCERTYHNPRSLEAAQQDKHRIVVSAAFETVHAEYHRYRGYDRDAYEFHSALLEALSEPIARQRWKAGQRAFRTVTDRTASQI